MSQNNKENTNERGDIVKDELNSKMAEINCLQICEILGSKKEIAKRNFIAGLFRGIGMGIGFTILTALLIYILQKIVILNIPGIGQFVSDIVEIVQQK